VSRVLATFREPPFSCTYVEPPVLATFGEPPVLVVPRLLATFGEPRVLAHLAAFTEIHTVSLYGCTYEEQLVLILRAKCAWTYVEWSIVC
jgi:hypothetical protein